MKLRLIWYCFFGSNFIMAPWSSGSNAIYGAVLRISLHLDPKGRGFVLLLMIYILHDLLYIILS